MCLSWGHFWLFLRVNTVKFSARFARKESLILKGKSMFLIMFRAKREENFELLRISKGKSIAFLCAKRAGNCGGFQG